MSCAHVIAACTQNKDYANIILTLYVLSGILWRATVRIMLDCFILILIHDIGQRTMGLLSYHLKLEGSRVTHLLFAYAVLWMKGAKSIDAIGVGIANKWVIVREGAGTHRHHHLPLGKYVYGYLCNTLVCK